MFNFSDVVIFWINNPTNTKRFENIQKILKEYFPNNKSERIDAVMQTPKFQGVSMAHTVALLKGLNCKKPFIILEDDITVNNNFLNIKTLEEQINRLSREPQAVYLGLSIWGSKGKNSYQNIFKNSQELMVQDKKIYYFRHGGKAKNYNDFFVKLVDMFSAHSILYLKEEYAVKTLKYIILAVALSKPHDIYLPKLMCKNFVIAIKKPWFYQLGTLGGQEIDTNVKIETNIDMINDDDDT